MKKIVLILISCVMLFTFTGCDSKPKDYLPEIMESLEKNIVSIREKSEEVMRDDGSLVDKMNQFDQELYTKEFHGGDVTLMVDQCYSGISVSIFAPWNGSIDDAKQCAMDTYFEIYDYFNENGIVLGRFYSDQKIGNDKTEKLVKGGNYDDEPYSCIASVGDLESGMTFEVYLLGDLVNPSESEVINLYR